jgi:NAD(P)H-flavin reductase
VILATIRFEDQEFERNEGETVLDVLHNHDIPAPFSCRRGVCQSCMLKAVAGEVPERAQEGLASKLKEENYFLACLCWPKTDLEIEMPKEEELCIRARVFKRDDFSENLCRLYLQTEKPLDYYAGQFINIHKSETLIRSYSLASVPQQDDMLELHVRREGDGKMSNWILDELQRGVIFEIQGPNGDCYYRDDKPEQNILMVGTGTGLAPLLGIAKDALLQGHSGQIHLYHGSSRAEGLYCIEDLKTLAEQYANFSFHTCLSREDVELHRDGRASDLALDDHPDLRGWRVYLCGEPRMIEDTRDNACHAGARFSDVIIDPYEHS